MHPARGTRIPPKGLQSPLEGRAPHRDTGPYKGPICRENAYPPSQWPSPLRARERPFEATSGLRSSEKFGRFLCAVEHIPSPWPGVCCVGRVTSSCHVNAQTTRVRRSFEATTVSGHTLHDSIGALRSRRLGAGRYDGLDQGFLLQSCSDY